MEGFSPGNAPLGRNVQIFTDTLTPLHQSLGLKVPSVDFLTSPPATETQRLYGSRPLMCEFLPDHRLIPTFFHCRIDSIASVYLEAGSWSSERPRDSQMWANFYMSGVTMVKLKENMLSVTMGKYFIFFLQQYSYLCNHKMLFLTDTGGLQGLPEVNMTQCLHLLLMVVSRYCCQHNRWHIWN